MKKIETRERMNNPNTEAPGDHVIPPVNLSSQADGMIDGFRRRWTQLPMTCDVDKLEAWHCWDIIASYVV